MTGSIKAKTKLRLREMLDEAIAQGVTAGVSLGIWQDGEELFFTAQGYADQEAKRPMERNTIPPPVFDVKAGHGGGSGHFDGRGTA